SNALSSRGRGVRLLDAVKHYFVSRCDSFYVPSDLAAEYLREFGADEQNIVVGKNSCDSAKFAECDHIGDGHVPTLIFVGQLIERKGVREMMAALDQVSQLSWKLRVVGVGPLMHELHRWVDQKAGPGRVELLGNVQQDRLSEVYRSGDILLFPSLLDPHPLVVLEALLSGQFVLGTDRSAATRDYIRSGLNGELF